MYVRDYVLKVASRCNLNCSYCYMYHHADQSYRTQPLLMSEQVVEAVARRVEEHRRGDADAMVRLTLHGGEPLLFGKERLIELVRTFDQVLGESYQLGLQTNGVLLDESWIELLDRLNIFVGISIDGPEIYHDRYRVDHQGKGSHNRVEQAIRLLQSSAAGQRIFGSTLTVVDLSCPPETLYAYLRGLDLLNFDVLLPDHNLQYPPEQREDAPYGQYLARLFECWLAENNPGVQIGFFEDAIGLMLRKSIPHSFWGLQALPIAVIETDGSLEPPDYFKSCAPEITKQGLNILHDPIRSLLETSLMQQILEPEPSLCVTCRGCQWKEVCGGGLLSHRFHEQNQFDNPSVYCADIEYFLACTAMALDTHLAAS